MHYKVIKYLTQSTTKKIKMYTIIYSALLQRKHAAYNICHLSLLHMETSFSNARDKKKPNERSVLPLF